MQWQYWKFTVEACNYEKIDFVFAKYSHRGYLLVILKALYPLKTSKCKIP